MAGICKFCGFSGTNDAMMQHAGECPIGMDEGAIGLLDFSKPKKARPSEEHNEYTSDCGIPGTYAPNMSREDRQRWKGKIVGKSGKRPLQIEIRKDSFVTVVGLKGYNYKHYKVGDYSSDTTGLNIHVASAGPIQMTFEDWEEWRQVVEEAKKILENF